MTIFPHIAHYRICLLYTSRTSGGGCACASRKAAGGSGDTGCPAQGLSLIHILEHGMCHCDTCGMKITIEEIRIQQGGKSYHRKQKDLFKRRSGGGAEQGDRAAACTAWFSAFPQRGRNALAYTGGVIGEHPRQYVVQPLQRRGRGRHLICTCLLYTSRSIWEQEVISAKILATENTQ